MWELAWSPPETSKGTRGRGDPGLGKSVSNSPLECFVHFTRSMLSSRRLPPLPSDRIDTLRHY